MSNLFPKWMNAVPTLAAGAAAGGLLAVIVGVWYYATPDYLDVGYMPTQPGAGFNHQLHAGQLGIDCRYCHTNVEDATHANVPTVSTCMGCHAEGRLRDWDVHEVTWVREAYAEDRSIEWRRVHKLPDHVRKFPHHVHVRAGVSCYSCHGQIMGMPEVYQAEPLSMGWCLDCHRNPVDHMVPPEKVTDLLWVENELYDRAHGQGSVSAEDLIRALREAPPQNCASCHH